jgi:prepilin signal peptidase PulO-like enzyme (type II secretory pathway)
VLAFEKVFFSAGAVDFGALGIFHFFTLAAVFSALVVLFVYDLRYYIIPDRIIYFAIAVVLLSDVVTILTNRSLLNFNEISSILFPAILAGGFFLFLIIITKGKGMGGGDVKLGFLMGLVLGFPEILLALFIAFISGAVVGILLILLHRKKMQSMVPFGPFLILGFLVSYFFGAGIIDWYWGMFLG